MGQYRIRVGGGGLVVKKPQKTSDIIYVRSLILVTKTFPGFPAL